ncbi:ABC transporter ATP-binding protein [Lysobacter enzymogenes]|uniref:ABC-2 type transport system ATP-binding protein n=1 Tax=Lysobacter enzymogenes TaxID=69 RepID=A0AAU9ABC7_LYSEN|nr:ABC transporter ATP-binding protein [Lysobacter enzymogenes]BAV95917.1 ABC-2 type transport system ATP-binding protein [Lysobacter enzymogenes]
MNLLQTATDALRLDGVRKDFGDRHALQSLSLGIAPGEVYALLGPNGAGKTTTLNLILGFLDADGGRIEVAGIDVARDRLGARARIAYLPETVMLHPQLDAIENLSYFALLGGRRIDGKQARDLLTQAGLQAEAHTRRAGGFSKGMRQKVGLAIALAKDAQLLLLDEPTSGLDASAANDLSHGVRAASRRGVAVLMATHDLYRVKDVAHRLGILSAGRLLTERRTAELSASQIEALYLQELDAAGAVAA